VQAIGSLYTNAKGEKSSFGSIGHLATFSFHVTINIIISEDSMLAINDDWFTERAELIGEKGTIRTGF